MNAVIYAKYYGENDIKNISLEEQIEMCNQYAKDNDLKVIKIYKDYGGCNEENKENRQEFQHMIEDSKNKEFQIVIVSSFDRFAISRYDSTTYKRKLWKNNVKVNSVIEPIPNDSSGILMESFIESMNEYYSLKLR